MSAQIRKLYIDSRIGCTGNPSDFTFQLPSAVPTTVYEGIVISQLNMPNLFTTVMADFSDRLYFSLNLQDQLGLVTGLNNRIYVLARTAGPVFTGRILTIAPGSYATIGAYITAVQAAFRAVWPTWTISSEGAKYKIITDPTKNADHPELQRPDESGLD